MNIFADDLTTSMYRNYLLLILVWALGPLTYLSAQTTYFQQDFSAGGTPNDYVRASPNNTQFNALAGLNATITNNAVQFTRPTDTGTGHIAYSTNFAGPPTSLHVQFSFEVLSHDVSVAGTSAVIFYVGSGFNSGPQNPDVAETYARLNFNLPATTSGQFQVRTSPQGGGSGGTNSAAFSGRQTITFAMNNTGSSNFRYVSPTGSLESLANDTYDVWVGNTKVFDDQLVLTPSQSISNFKFRINNGVGIIQIGNLLMRDISGALPVTLLSFTAKPEGDRVQLAWSTTSELNAQRFIVERSTDLAEYVPIGEIAAKGTTNSRQNYSLTDIQPLPGNNYYRLRQIDHDGTSQVFKPVAAVVSVDDVAAVVYPNPADPARIHLRLWNTGDGAVRLLTQGGQYLESRIVRSLDGVDLVPQHPLQTGVYLVEVQAGDQKIVRKVLIR